MSPCFCNISQAYYCEYPKNLPLPPLYQTKYPNGFFSDSLKNSRGTRQTAAFTNQLLSLKMRENNETSGNNRCYRRNRQRTDK